ncbi:protein-cysteine N-palmitoyltransferase HHAT [Hydra vulgaris]|uniref:Protein-cysteine N-palmitoyltransferase HHAT n=1 Tax=Hydra vulgaris TaxID=6087 RepID=A0ABM4CMV4_HYDVU
MSNAIIKKRSDSYYKHPSFGLIESMISWWLWPCLALYPIYYSFQLSKKFEHHLVDGCLDTGWFSLRRDVTDYEWTDFRDNSTLIVIVNLLYSILGRLVALNFPKVKKFYYSVAGAFLVLIIMSFQGFLLLCIIIFIFYFVIEYFNRKTMWLFVLIFIVSFHKDTCRQYLFLLFCIKAAKSGVVYISVLMTILRIISYGTERNLETFSFTFTDFLSYMFYIPLFFRGPLLTFDLFVKDFNQPLLQSSIATLKEFCIGFLRCVTIGFIIDIYYHYSSVNALSSHHHVLQNLNEIETIAVGWSLIIMFYVKYKVFYGLAYVFTKIDQIESPSPPRCVCTLYTFVDMWRYFDQGLYRLLQRSIYFQIGGLHRTFSKTLFAAFCCFGFVSIWHGNNKQYWYWGFFNFFGICIEHFISKVIRSKRGNTFCTMIGLLNFRRVVGFSGSLSILSLIYSNLVFVASIESANIIYQKMLLNWYMPAILIFIFYFSTQVSIDLHYTS